MPSHEVLVREVIATYGITQLCNRDARRTVLVIINLGINAANYVRIQDDPTQQLQQFRLTEAWQYLVLKSSDGFDVTKPWYAFSNGADEYVSVYEEFLSDQIFAELKTKGITSTAGASPLLLMLLLGGR
jgi:hypothetical protein